MISWLVRSTLAFSALLVLVSGCDSKPADGKSCDADKDSVLCTDPQTRMACEGGKWHAETCLGPGGCSVTGSFVKCDASLSNEGTACDKEGNLSCTLDKKTMLKCQGSKWAPAQRCLGPSGCNASGFLALCDTSTSQEGDLCMLNEKDKDKASYACTMDKKAMLTCVDTKWKKIESCTGPDGCHGAMLLSCDGPTVNAGDFCLKGDKDDYACSADKKSSLKCEVGGWKVVNACLGPEGCTSSSLGVKCDDSVKDPTSTCEKDGAAYCSTDGKTILECKGGKLAKARSCPKACKVSYSTIECE